MKNILVGSTFYHFYLNVSSLKSLKHHWEQGYEVGLLRRRQKNYPLVFIMHILGSLFKYNIIFYESKLNKTKERFLGQCIAIFTELDLGEVPS